MEDFQKVNGMQCKILGHSCERIIMICLNLKCQFKNRFLCFKCIKNENHCSHIEDCIQFFSAPKFLKNSLKILEKTLETQFYDTLANQKSFKLFFEKKLLQLNKLYTQFDDLVFVKNNLEYLEFAYNILSLQKYFFKGFPDIINHELVIYQLENIFETNQNIYIEEAKCKAYIYKFHNYYEEAIRCCNKALDFKLDNEILCVKGSCLNFLDRLEEADEILELAQELDPQNMKIALLRFMVSDSRRIVDFNFLSAYQQLPDLKNLAKAHCLIQEQQQQEALKLLDECIEQYPENFIAITLKGKCFFQLRNLEEAKKISKIMLQIYPKYYQALALEAQILEAEGKYDEFYQLMEQYKHKFKPFERVFLLSNSYIKQKKTSEAEQLLKEIPEHMRGNREYQNMTTMLWAYSINFDKTKENIKSHCYPISPQEKKQIDYIIIDCLDLFEKGNFEQCLSTLEQGLALDRTSTACLALKVYVLYVTSKFPQAIETYNVLINIDPKFKKFLNFEGLMAKLTDQKFSQQYFDAKQENFKILYEQAFYFQRTKQYNEASKIYRRIHYTDINQFTAQLQELLCQVFQNNIKNVLDEIEDILKYKKNNLLLFQLKGKYFLYILRKALSVFDEIEKIDPNFTLLEFNKANCYFKLKKYHIALQFYESSCQRTSCPNQIQSLKMHKTLYALHLKDENKLSQILMEVQEFKNQTLKGGEIIMPYIVWATLILLDNNIHQYNDAKKLFEFYPESEIIQIIYAQTMLALKQMTESIKVYNQILIKNPQNLLALVGLAQVYKKQNFTVLFEEFQKQALGINKKAFDQEVWDDILIEELDELLEINIMCVVLGLNNQQVFPKLNTFF